MTPVLQGGREGSCSSSGKSHRRHSGHFWIWLQRFLVEVEGERCTQKGRVGVLRRGLGKGDECWRNVPGMSDGAF